MYSEIRATGTDQKRDIAIFVHLKAVVFNRNEMVITSGVAGEAQKLVNEVSRNAEEACTLRSWT
jgi:hypothetical protein